MADRLRGFPKPQLGCLTTQPNAQSVYNPLFYPLLPRNPLSERIQRNSNIENKKRKATNHANCSSDLPDVYRQYFPSIYPAIPNTFHRHIQLGLPNPLISPGEAEPCHPRLAYLSGQSNNEENHKQLEVDGFVKAGFDPIFARNMVYSGRSRFDFHTEDQHIFFYQAPTQLPPEFGGVAFGDDHIGREMWEFFLHAIVPGRTVIKNDNAYLQEIAPMARTNNLVRHAILALSPTYMLDYMALPEIEERAKFHHGMAVELLTKELNNLEVYDPGSGRETPIVAALILLAHNQIVNWQTWRGTQGASKWYLTATKAEYLLESSDPAYHYRDPNNVQFTKARFALGQLVCLDTVLSDPIFPLDITAGRCRVPWILHGTEHERLRIVGMNGLSPQLMHYFAKITFFAAMIFKETQSAANTFQGVSTFGPTNMGCVTVLMEILEKLKNLRQWSTITIGLSSEEVLCSVHLTEDGKVQDPIDVTQLIAASYVEAAQIYLQCRALRRPREHIEVQRSLLRLLKLIEWQPTSGKLFTAQTPLFAVFIAGIVSSTQYQRAVVKKWFKATTEESRGNVMPVWMALQELWSLQDTTGNFNETVPFMDIEVNYPAGAHAWWEDMVKAVVDSHGRLNLA